MQQVSLAHIDAGLSKLAEWLEDQSLAASVTPPDSVGRAADLYHDIREVRLRADKVAETIAKFESAAKQHIVDNLSKSDDTGAAGLRYRAQITVKPRARVAQDGWQLLHAYIRQTGRFDLLQKRLLDSAVMDMVSAGETPPGVETFNEVGISITKI